jgi:hypothetical protein
MSEGISKTQPDAQAGSPGEAAEVGLEVGVPHRSEEASVMGAEQRRGTCSDVSSGTRLKAPRGDMLRGRKVPNADFSGGGNASAEPNSERCWKSVRPV